jgi:hypothetical protein
MDSLEGNDLHLQHPRVRVQKGIRMRLPLMFEEIVNEIVRHTRCSREEVAHRVWMEALEPG